MFLKDFFYNNIYYLAKFGLKSAQYKYAKYLLANSETVESIIEASKWLEKATDRKHPHIKSCYNLAIIYEHLGGFISECNPKFSQDKLNVKIIELLKIASQNNIAKAQTKLGIAYWTGKYNLEVNNKLAHDYFTLAAKQLDPQALCNLGIMYISGEIFEDKIMSHENELNMDTIRDGLKIDNKKAYDYFIAASKLDNGQAYYMLAEMSLNNQHIKKDLEYIFNCYKQAVDNGYIKAALHLAECYECGHGTKQDYRQSFKWYETASRIGIKAAKSKLADFYVYGHGVKKNPIKAEYYLKNLAKSGDPKMQFKLATLYDTTKSNLQNYTKAKEWYLKAAQQGDIKAQINLAALYLKGDGMISPCEKTAKFWLESAAVGGDEVAKYNLKQLNLINVDDYITETFGAENKIVH